MPPVRSRIIRFMMLAACVAAAACGSAEKRNDSGSSPDWVRLPTRTVDNGYLVYVGSGEDRDQEKARFKAESMAIQDLANECSFAPKGTRVEDRYDGQSGIVYRSYAKVAVEIQDCENAKAAATPEQIRALANAQLAEELKRYRDLVDEPEPDEAQPLVLAHDGAPPPSSSSAPSSVSGAWPVRYFVIRQQVVLAKEIVILAPPAQYPPQEPQTIQPIPRIIAANTAIRGYEQADPRLKTSPPPFSQGRPNWLNHQASSLRETAAERQRIRQAYAKPQSASANRRQGRSNPARGRRGRRRRAYQDSRGSQ